MKTVFKSLAAAAFLSLAAPMFAQDYVIIDRRVDEFDRWQDRVDYSYGAPVIAREFDVPVVVLEEQRTRTSLGYGGLMIANALARETGRPFEEIVAMKESGMGWGRIAQENGVKLGPIVSRFDRVDRGFRSQGNVKRDQMKAAKFVNGHDARDGRLDKVKPAKFRGGSNGQRVMKVRGSGGKPQGAGRGNKGGGGGRGKK
jgi:hypothetical protein